MATANIIRAESHKSPMYFWIIQGVGPPLLPFHRGQNREVPEKERQQIFLEPEGIAPTKSM